MWQAVVFICMQLAAHPGHGFGPSEIGCLPYLSGPYESERSCLTAADRMDRALKVSSETWRRWKLCEPMRTDEVREYGIWFSADDFSASR